jgi:hypothetical protein
MKGLCIVIAHTMNVISMIVNIKNGETEKNLDVYQSLLRSVLVHPGANRLPAGGRNDPR